MSLLLTSLFEQMMSHSVSSIFDSAVSVFQKDIVGKKYKDAHYSPHCFCLHCRIICILEEWLGEFEEIRCFSVILCVRIEIFQL